MECAPCELTVTDFAAARRTKATGFTDRVWWEVIVQQEALAVITVQRVDALLVVARAESRYTKRLCLAAREQRRTVGPWQDANVGLNTANRRKVTAVDPLAGFNDVAANDGFFQLLDASANGVVVFEFLFGETLFDHIARSRDFVLTLGLINRTEGIAHRAFAKAADFRVERRVVGLLNIEWLFCTFFCKRDNQINHGLDRLVTEHHSAEHHVFAQLRGFGLDHHDGVLRTGHNEIEFAVDQIFRGWVQLVLAVDVTNTATADWTHERCARDCKSRRCRNHRNHVRIVLKVMAENGTDNLRLVFETIDEKRTDWTVDQARCQSFFFGRTRFAF